MTVCGAGRIVVGVRDQRRALEFWVTKIGFELAVDAPYGDSERWVEVRTPDGLALVLTPDPACRYQNETGDRTPNANPFFYTRDIRQTYHDLAGRGVVFAEEPSEQPWGWWSMFQDTEGNRFALQQR